MKLVVVGGQSRNVGKTSLACGIVAGLPERRWTAVKITQFGHGLCAADGKPCECAVDDPDHPWVLSRETDREGGADTSRMLRAGAQEVYWLRVLQGRLAEAMPLLRERLEGKKHVVVESNSVLDYLTPDVYLSVVDEAVEDYKASARRLLSMVDAFAVVGGESEPAGKPRFAVEPPEFCTPELIAFVEERLVSPRHSRRPHSR